MAKNMNCIYYKVQIHAVVCDLYENDINHTLWPS